MGFYDVDELLVFCFFCGTKICIDIDENTKN